MAFRVWAYFMGFVLSMLVVLWMLQITFLEPYYKSSRTKSIAYVITEVQRYLGDSTEVDYQPVLRTLFAKENMCGIVYDANGIAVMDLAVDLMGKYCYLNDMSRTSRMEYIDRVNASSTQEIDIPFRNEYFEQSMSFYGKQIHVNEMDYYIFINTPMELLNSTVDILKSQFMMVAVIILSLGTFTALLLSRRLSSPIVKMNDSAKRLAKGDFTVHFEEEGYNEAIQLSKTLNYATDEFGKTDELRRDLVANVSHDIKTPLTMIKAYAEMIIDISGDDPDMRQKHLKVILDETNHLERLVNDMLTLSKYESKVFNVKESRYNLKDQVESTLNLFQGLNIHFKVDINRKIFVMADEIKMGQVLYNFVNNATRHIGLDNTVYVEAKATKNVVTVSVRDTGEGIDKDYQKTIWDRYTQINKHHHRNDASTGLGLSIVAAICEATGSDYGVVSEPGQGASFYYTLKRTK